MVNICLGIQFLPLFSLLSFNSLCFVLFVLSLSCKILLYGNCRGSSIPLNFQVEYYLESDQKSFLNSDVDLQYKSLYALKKQTLKACICFTPGCFKFLLNLSVHALLI